MLDRASHRRREREWLQRAWNSPDARLLACGAGGLAVDPDPGADGEVVLARLAPPAGIALEDVIFLGVQSGRALFGAALDTNALPDVTLTPSLQALARLDGDDSELAAQLLSLTNWHRAARFCGRCGAPTEAISAGHARRCTGCATSHFPRTDAVVQVLVHDGERCLLGRSEPWPATFFSLVAGFVEPGETPSPPLHVSCWRRHR